MDTRQEFFNSYDITRYERPSVTADVAAFRVRSKKEKSYRKDPDTKLSLLLIKRGEQPFKGFWALPGGFLRPGETIEDCAVRETEEETGLKPVSIMQVGTFSTPGRDPRGWIISNAYACVITGEAAEPVGGDDAASADWFDLDLIPRGGDLFELVLSSGEEAVTATVRKVGERFGRARFVTVSAGGLAFDHAEIIACALFAVRASSRRFEVAFDFLPEKFTLTALQRVQEVITGEEMLSANFRRKVSGMVEETDEFVTGAGHRPAKLFVRRKGGEQDAAD